MHEIQTPLLDPAVVPQVAVESMNRTHREEVDLINRLGAYLAQGMQGEVDDVSITTTLNDWVEHTRHHFEGENRLMLQYGFPAYHMHLGEHERVLSLIEEHQRQWREKRRVETLADFVFEEWPSWFDHHLNTMDWVTARFITGQGG